MVINLRMTITDTIRRFRDKAGLTQESIAERLNTTRSNYAYLENRGEKLTLEQLEGIAEALGVSMIDIIIEAKELKPEDIVLGGKKNDSDAITLKSLLGYLELLKNISGDFAKSIQDATTLELVLHAVKQGIISEHDCKGWFNFNVEVNEDTIIPIEIDYESIEERGIHHDDVYPSRVMTEKQLVKALKGLDFRFWIPLHTLFNSGLMKDKVLHSAIDRHYRSMPQYRGKTRIK